MFQGLGDVHLQCTWGRFDSVQLHMGKLEKKKLKLQERIDFLQNEMVSALTKKTSDTKEISVGDYQRKIIELKNELKQLKWTVKEATA